MLSRSRVLLKKAAFSTSSVAKISQQDILVAEEHPNVFHVKLNRPKKLNTFTIEMWKELKTTIDNLAEEPKCRAIVISGEGRAFTGGIDLAGGMMDLVRIIQDDTMDIGRKARFVGRAVQKVQDSFNSLEKCPKPIITAVHSHCVGAGVDMILACDIRFASQDVNFSVREVDIGMAADIGTLNRIQKVVGNDSWTREVCFTGRDFGADEALRFGMISRIFADRKELLEGAMDQARRIAEKSPIAVQGIKETLNYAREHTTADSLNFIKVWNMSQLLSTDLMNSALAAMQKEKATYEDV